MKIKIIIGAILLALVAGCGSMAIGSSSMVAIIGGSHGGMGGGATTGSLGGAVSSKVPANLVPWLNKAAAMCKPLTPALLATQDWAESDFNPNEVSPAGAKGISQIMDMSLIHDDDGNGVASPFDVGDAIMAQGREMCSYVPRLSVYTGDTFLTYLLASYNAGPYAVLPVSCKVATIGGPCQAHVPPYPETQNYVKKILGALASFTLPGSIPAGIDPALKGTASSAALAAVAAERSQLGVPYVWGGGGLTGPSDGGFDCSGLVRYAWYVATGGKVELPRVASDQINATKEISKSQLAPGDLIFFQTEGPGNWSHVGMYIGGGQMIHAPHTGDVVKIADLSTSYWQNITSAYRRVQ